MVGRGFAIVLAIHSLDGPLSQVAVHAFDSTLQEYLYRPRIYTMRWVTLPVFSQQYWFVTGLTRYQHAAIRRRISIALTIRSLDCSYKRIWPLYRHR